MFDNAFVGHDEKTTEVESRQKLIQSGLKLFASKGYEGTTVRDIADQAGVNLSLVSYYFQGKLGLYRAALEEFANNRSGVARQLLGKPAESVEELRIRLSMLLDEMISFQITNPYPCQIIMQEIDQGLPHASDIFEKTLLQTYGMLVTFFEDAKKKGFIKKNVDPMIVTQIFQGAVFHLGRVENVRKKYFKQSMTQAQHKKNYMDQMMNLFFHGIVSGEKS